MQLDRTMAQSAPATVDSKFGSTSQFYRCLDDDHSQLCLIFPLAVFPVESELSLQFQLIFFVARHLRSVHSRHHRHHHHHQAAVEQFLFV